MSKQHDYPSKAPSKVDDSRSTNAPDDAKTAKPAKDADKPQTAVLPGGSSAAKPGQKA